MKQLLGYVRTLCACSAEACSDGLMFEAFDGVGVEFMENEAGAPIDELIEATFDGKRLVSFTVSDLRPVVDERRKDIALIRYAKPGVFNAEEDGRILEKGARGLEDWLHQVNRAGGYMWDEVRVTPYLLETDRMMPGPASMNLYRFEEELRSQHPDRWDSHNYWHTWGGAVPGPPVGLAGVNARKAWTARVGDLYVLCHEQGHNLGCGHSSTPTAEYRTFDCTMGLAKHTGLCAPQLAAIKGIDGDLIADAETDRRYFLCPVEVTNPMVYPGEIKILRIPYSGVPTGYLTASVRKTREQSRLGTGDELVVAFDETRHGFNYTPIARGYLNPGQARTFDGLQIRYVGSSEGVVELEVGSAAPLPFPEPPRPAGDADEIEDRHSGLWNDPRFQHQGIFFAVKGNQAKGYMFTHYPRGSRRVGLMNVSSQLWMVLDGEYNPSTRAFDFTMHVPQDGGSVECGHGSLEIRGDLMDVRFYCEQFGRDHLELRQLTPDPTGPVEVRVRSPLDGYTMGQFGKTFMAIHFTTGHREELNWRIYIGPDEHELEGYRVEGGYCQTFEGKVTRVADLDLDAVRILTREFPESD